MGSVYDEIDIHFSWNGDFSQRDGDLAATTDDVLAPLEEQCHSIIKSVSEDWEFTPERAANLDDYIGEPNTARVANELRDRIRISLISSDVVLDSDLQVQVTPVGPHNLLIILTIAAASTAINKLLDNVLTISFVYDSTEKQVFVLRKKPDILLSI